MPQHITLLQPLLSAVISSTVYTWFEKIKKVALGIQFTCKKSSTPVHATSVDCSDVKCTLELQLAGRGKMTATECRHLLLVNNASYPDRVNLSDDKILELGQDNRFKLLKNETIAKCIKVNRQAIETNAPTVVQWQDGNYVHMSSFDFNMQSIPVLMR